MTNRQKIITEVEAFDIQKLDIKAIEEQARQLRAETLAEFGRQLRTWFKSLDVGFAARTTH